MIDLTRAKEIASYWHGPSPHDDQITRLSHGMEVTDWERLEDQVERNLALCVGPSDGDAARELTELLEWVRVVLAMEAESRVLSSLPELNED